MGNTILKKNELFRLDREELFLHNSYYEKEVEDILFHPGDIKKIRHYTFTPVEEGEFRLIADYIDCSIHIKLLFCVVDKISLDEIKDKGFTIETTESLLHDFLTELKRGFISICENV